MRPEVVLVNVVVFILALGVARIILEVWIRGKQRSYDDKEKYQTICIRVSKENEAGPIVAEQIYSALHGVIKKISFWERLKGVVQDRISFELANTGKNIAFYVNFPSKLKNLVESQIYAQYPLAEIADCDDYAKKPDGYYIHSVELGLINPDIYPVKRYPQFEDKKAKYPVDPLASVTASLSKFAGAREQAWIQVIIRPIEDKWRKRFTRCIRVLAKGAFLKIEKIQAWYARMYCTRNALSRFFYGPLYILFALKRGNNVSTDNAKVDDAEEQISRTHENETPLVAAMDKVGRLMYETTIRIVYLCKHNNPETAEIKLKEIAGTFKQFNLPQVNGFEIRKKINGDEAIEKFSKRRIRNEGFVLNSEELATIYHLPNLTVNVPNINWVKSRRIEPPNDLPVEENEDKHDLTIIGKTNFRGATDVFGIKTADRRRHIYIIGKTGMGKSTLLENMIFSDIQEGRGLAVIDPHGDLAESVLNFIPARRTNDVILFDPSDRDYPIAFNMLENIDPSLNSIVCSGLVGIFKKIYADSWGPRLEHILRNTILSLLEYPNTTMLGISRVLQDKSFRQKVIKKISDPIVKAFWLEEFEKMDPRQRVEAISPILNKVGQFLSSSIIRNILGQVKSSMDIRFAMDKKKIIIVNLSKGKIGEDNSSLLGSMLITKFQLDAMSRANIPEKDRTDFYLYVDEFQNFATESFATILSEARKYKLNLTMANQYIAQMPDEVREAVFGNVGSILSFQVGFDDADYLSKQFGEEVMPNDLVALSKYNAYMRLLNDGMPSKTFSMNTMPPPEFEMEEGRKEKVIKMSRERYATEKKTVEDKITRWSLSGKETERLEINKNQYGHN